MTSQQTSHLNGLRASFYTLGCRLNEAETSLISNKFRAGGYQVVDFEQPTDVCIINSCTVTEQADAKCRNLVRRVLRRNPQAYVAIIGCYAQLGYERLAQIDGVDLIVGNAEKMRVFDYVGDEPLKRAEPQVVRPRMSRDAFKIDHLPTFSRTTRANLKIQDGCDFMCGFCVIPMARGRARSRDFHDLQREAQQLVQRGHQELVLTGVNIGTYQFEGYRFLDVVKMLLDVDGLRRLRISSIEPTTFPDELLELMGRSELLCPHLHLPLQSGSATTLERMRRKHDLAEFDRLIRLADELVPGIQIATDLIVGYPGETEREFSEGCEYFANSPMAYAHIFTYSLRRGTFAAKLPEQVDFHEKKRRSRVLHEISNRKRAQFFCDHIGQTLRVLTEEQRDDRWVGYSDNYVRVAFTSSAPLESNQLVSVKIDAVERGMALGTRC